MTQYALPPPLSSPMGAQAPCASQSRCNVAVLSYSEYIPTLTAAAALCVKAMLSRGLVTLTFDLESGVRVTWATSVPILVFLGLSVLDLGPMYVTHTHQRDRRQTKHYLMPQRIRGGGITSCATCSGSTKTCPISSKWRHIFRTMKAQLIPCSFLRVSITSAFCVLRKYSISLSFDGNIYLD